MNQTNKLECVCVCVCSLHAMSMLLLLHQFFDATFSHIFGYVQRMALFVCLLFKSVFVLVMFSLSGLSVYYLLADNFCSFGLLNDMNVCCSALNYLFLLLDCSPSVE